MRTYPKTNMPTAVGAIQREVRQSHSQRKPYLRRIQQQREGRTVVSFFISFEVNEPLSQKDADVIEEIFCNTDTSKGITLILDAPGGAPLAAERIIQICRKYGGDKGFETVVPARAKSAATMVCLGSDRILMSPTSELGPIDPQVPMQLYGDLWEWVSAHHVIRTYDQLMRKAVALREGHIEPLLQQLNRFNAIHIEQLRSAAELCEHIAVRSLMQGMMTGKSEKEIKHLIKPFTNPKLTMSHGRALNVDLLKDCKLKIENMELEGDLWRDVWGLYMRSTFFVNAGEESPRKLVETVERSYHSGKKSYPRDDDDDL